MSVIRDITFVTGIILGDLRIAFAINGNDIKRDAYDGERNGSIGDDDKGGRQWSVWWQKKEDNGNGKYIGGKRMTSEVKTTVKMLLYSFFQYTNSFIFI